MFVKSRKELTLGVCGGFIFEPSRLLGFSELNCVHYLAWLGLLAEMTLAVCRLNRREKVFPQRSWAYWLSSLNKKSDFFKQLQNLNHRPKSQTKACLFTRSVIISSQIIHASFDFYKMKKSSSCWRTTIWGNPTYLFKMTFFKRGSREREQLFFSFYSTKFRI